MNTFTITLTEAQKSVLTAKAQAEGISPAGGELPTEHGVSLSFAVSGDVVTFTVISKPWWMPVSTIQSGILDYVSSAA